MFVILVYDVNQKRLAKVLRTCRKYLHWVQNSVFEGDISEARMKRLKMELARVMDPAEDSIVIYYLRTTRYSSREVVGLNKGGQSIII